MCRAPFILVTCPLRLIHFSRVQDTERDDTEDKGCISGLIRLARIPMAAARAPRGRLDPESNGQSDDGQDVHVSFKIRKKPAVIDELLAVRQREKNLVPMDHSWISAARLTGICLGDND